MPDGKPAEDHPTIIGFTGSFGSGCSYVVEKILKPMGFTRISLSDLLKKRFKESVGNANVLSPSRHDLQEFGDKIRKEEGSGVLAEEAIKIVNEKSPADSSAKFVVDSIRNPKEIRALRRRSHRFFLFGLYADKQVRWERVRGIYADNWAEFDKDDRNDTGNENELYGQRVGDCFYEADVVVANNKNFVIAGNTDFQALAGRVSQYIDLVTHPLDKQQPLRIRKEEALMAMAYAASQQSSCLKRKVGAIIVDGTGSVISSGFNEVPMHEKPCRAEYADCYRNWLYNDFFATLKTNVPAVAGHEPELQRMFRKKFKILDCCRALHAEEIAILNLARNGRSTSLGDGTLYTTTYPCRLCANKIASVGIKHVVYFEPYPDDEAKVILRDAGVRDEFFEGVTFKAYFRIYGEEK